jgi:glycosyltransferase involved in cell wall biosynthesis
MPEQAKPVPVPGCKGKLVFIVNVDWFFISHRVALARAARDSGWDVHVFTTDTGRAGEIEAEGMQVRRIPMGRAAQNPLLEFFCLWSIISGLRRARPTIVHCVAFKSAILGGLAARLCRAPGLVIAVTGMGSTLLRETWKTRLWKTVVFSLMKYICRPDTTQMILQNVDDLHDFVSAGVLKPEQVTLIRGSGIKPSSFGVLDETDVSHGFVCILPARLLKDKGVYEFVDAARILKSRTLKAKVRMILVGPVDPHNRTSVPLSDLKMWTEGENILEWTGHTDAMSEMYQRCHVVVLPSYREGLPKVLIEAGASRRSSITTDVPGCREIIKHEFNGLLVPPKNGVALADAIERLLVDDDLRTRLAQNAHALVINEYCIDTVVSKTFAIYDKLVEKR